MLGGLGGDRIGRLAAVAGLGVGLAASEADATWSILIANTRTGEIAVASATCLTSINLRHETPVLISGVGGATAQSFVDQSGRNRGLVRDLLLAGVEPGLILDALDAFDPSHQTRQYGIIDVTGGAATFSGTGAGAWAGGQTGRVGDLVYAVQGNVLAGAPVVQDAVDAILMTPGDIPEKLMAGMEAAFVQGGDGRCSCTSNGPDCGSPPQGGDFDKSAHVGYMLIARAGDADGSNSITNTKGVPLAWVVEDFDGDGRPDAACVTSAQTDNVSVLLNRTPVGSPLGLLVVEHEADAGATALQDAAGGDFTGDGMTDVLGVSLSADAAVLMTNLGGGEMSDGVAIGVGDGPRAVVAADLDGAGGLDAAVANETAGTVSVMLGAGDGTFAVTPVATFLGGPTQIVAGEFNGLPGTDLAMAHENLGAVTLLVNDGAGAFSPGGFFFVGARPVGLAALDADDDGLDDLVTANQTGRSVSVLMNTGGAFTRNDIAMPGNLAPSHVAAGRVDGDGELDLAVFLGGSDGLAVFAGDGAGGFSLSGAYPFVLGVGAAVVADFSGDGENDLLAGSGAVGGAVLAGNQGGGVFPDQPGFAAGEYFMMFNVANVQASDPDPVLQMRVQFDAWRADLTGRPDGVQSVATPPSGLLATGEGDGDDTARVRVRLADWRRVAVDLDASAFSVSHAIGSAMATQIMGVERVGPGLYDIVLGLGPDAGVDELVVEIDDGVRPVTLMPNPVVRVLDPDADFDGDGAATFSDVLAFLTAFAAEDPSADLDADKAFTIEDVLLFLALYNP